MYAINTNTLNLRMISERRVTTAFSPSQTVTNESSSPNIATTLTVDPQSDAPRNNITTQQVTKLNGEYMHIIFIPAQSKLIQVREKIFR